MERGIDIRVSKREGIFKGEITEGTRRLVIVQRLNTPSLIRRSHNRVEDGAIAVLLTGDGPGWQIRLRSDLPRENWLSTSSYRTLPLDPPGQPELSRGVGLETLTATIDAMWRHRFAIKVSSYFA